MKTVSIIIPIYGAEKFIEKCARSILEQTYKNLDIIFVNDCSPDRSVEILLNIIKEYPLLKDKIQILSYKKNRGTAGARQFGLEHVKGDYIIQFDSDDYVDSTMIYNLINKAEEEDSDIVISDFNLVQDSKITHIHVNPSLKPCECMCQVIEGKVHSSLCNKLIRTDLYKNNHVNFIEGLNMREDLSVMYKLLYFAQKISYLPVPFYNYVVRTGSVSSDRMNIKQQENVQFLIEEMQIFFTKQKISDKSILDAFKRFKVGIKCEILLHGDIKTLKASLYTGIEIRHYLEYPQMPMYQKLLGIISESGSLSILMLTRHLLDLIKPIKKIIK